MLTSDVFYPIRSSIKWCDVELIHEIEMIVEDRDDLTQQQLADRIVKLVVDVAITQQDEDDAKWEAEMQSELDSMQDEIDEIKAERQFEEDHAYDRGFSDGHTEGYDEGYDDGIREGREDCDCG